ncbi:hypothetical protein NWE60_00235 [Mycoplasmopsis felis]|nr:hypothetical protein [Mycoplasmopsis felis]MCU9934153.1 hypothetical protein [Mycoplasmopsis felis]WAM01123.1 hypothetical protein NWE60_00235 [Mycoplasmopsis felis]
MMVLSIPCLLTDFLNKFNKSHSNSLYSKKFTGLFCNELPNHSFQLSSKS